MVLSEAKRGERLAVEMEGRRAAVRDPLVDGDQSAVRQGQLPLSSAGPVDLEADIGRLAPLFGGVRRM